MKLLDTFIYQGIKYRIMSVRQPSHYETGRTYELLRYGVGLDRAYADDWLVLHEKDMGEAQAIESHDLGRQEGVRPSALRPSPATIIEWPFGVVRA